jgi:SpoIIAA-like
MIERIADMPSGTIGFRASGAVTADDYRSVLEPDLQQAAEAGEIRLLYMIDGDVDMTMGAVAQDAKTGLGTAIGHHSAWKRMAVVTDVEWVDRAMRAFGWMVPGEFRTFLTSDLEDAKRWVSRKD